MCSKPVLKIEWCNHEAAKYACEHWHYSKTIPCNKSNYLGIWEDGKFIGALIFGLGASPNLGTRYGLGIFEVCELTRVALTKHKTEVTRIIKIAMKMIKIKNRGIRLVVSFADAFHGHTGGIYQGGNWIYTGETQPSEMLRLPNGEMIDPRRFNGHGHNKKKDIPSGTVKIKTPGKHRYLFPLDDEIKANVLPLAKPYPKRASCGVNSESAVPAPTGQGGASPTTPLHCTGGV